MLQGIRVIECASWIAGPAAGSLLGAFGADVIKIEDFRGDPLRQFHKSPGMPAGDEHYAWHFGGSSKRSIAMDLKSPGGQQILAQLIASSDVLITNVLPSGRPKLGLDPEKLRQRHPTLVYASVTAYGEHGPDAELSGFDNVALWGRSGLMDLMREPKGQPIRTVPAAGDFATATATFAAVLLGLFNRTLTGRGDYVSTSLLGTGLWANAFNLQAALNGGTFEGLAHRTSSPTAINYVSYLASDGVFINFGHFPTEEWRDKLFIELGIPEGVTLDVEGQVGLIRSAISRETSAQWLTKLRAIGFMVDRAATVESLATDSQVRASHISKVAGGPGECVSAPFSVSGFVPQWKRAASLGEDAESILRELGYGAPDIDRLRQRAVIL